MKSLLDIQGLEVTYHTQVGQLKALHDVTFEVHPGEIVGIVGESGCGKSTVASSLLQLLPPNGEITAGQMHFQGRDLAAAPDARERDGHDFPGPDDQPESGL
jgi:ABC-type glutathione transport system ATPase component